MGLNLTKVLNWIKEKRNYLLFTTTTGILTIFCIIKFLKKKKQLQIPNENNLNQLLFSNSQPLKLIISTNEVKKKKLNFFSNQNKRQFSPSKKIQLKLKIQE